MGWLRLVGSLKLYVSFAKEPYKRDNILQKRPPILRSLPIVATPYVELWRLRVPKKALTLSKDVYRQKCCFGTILYPETIFCKRDLCFKETYDSIDPTDRSHPIDYPPVSGYGELRVPKKALTLSKEP